MEIPFPIEDAVNRDSKKPISPMKEMVAYEVLWRNKKMTFKQLSRMFASQPGKLPSELVPEEYIANLYSTVKEAALNDTLGYRTNLLIHGSFDYPDRLRQAEEPVEVLYYTGNVALLSTRSIAVVGTRKPSAAGLRHAAEVARFLVARDFTIISGLAAGIDTMAHTTAIAEKGRTIAVIGTPLDRAYPAENAALQLQIAREHLLVTQVPFIRYREQSIQGNRLFFPERNKTMSALSEATVIVEAGETSGTLIQARAALYQKRKLFILEPCFQNPHIGWPAEYLRHGAIRISNFEDILSHLTDGHAV
jgi:DNA processing protein